MDPSEISNLKFHASLFGSFTPPLAGQIHQFIVDLKESTGVSDTDLRSELERLRKHSEARTLNRITCAYWKSTRGSMARTTEDGRRSASARQALLAGRKIYSGIAAFAVQSANDESEAGLPEHESKMDKRFDASDLLRIREGLAQAYAGAGNDKEAEAIYKRIISADETDVCATKWETKCH